MKSRSNPFLPIVLTLAVASALPAATLYWDGATTTADADGGTGTWNTTTTNWDSAATAGLDVSWPGTSTGDDDAVFGVTGGAVNIDAGGITANDIEFVVAGYTLSGGTLTLDGTTNVLAATPNVNNVATIGAPVASTSGFTKTGSGTLTLNGENTSLSGTITVENPPVATNNGGLVLSGTNATGTVTTFNVNGSAAPTTDGGWLGLANGATIASGAVINLSGQGGNAAPQGTLRCTGGVATVDGAVNLLTGNARISNLGTSLTLNGPVTAAEGSGFGILLRNASNQGLIFTNTGNYWEGTTQIHDGSYYFEPGTLPGTSNLQMAVSASTWFETSGSFTRAIGTGAGQVQFNATAGRVNGFSARDGDLTVNIGGSLSPSTLVWGSAGFVPALLGLGGANSTGTVTWINPIDLNAANRSIHSANGAADVDGEISSVISGAAGSALSKSGNGVMLLSNANTHPGGTTIAQSQGVVNPLRISHANALGTGNLNIGGGGNNDQSRLELTGGITVTNTIPILTSRNNDVPNFYNVAGENTITSNVSSGGGGSRVTFLSDSGNLIFTGNIATRQLNLRGDGNGELRGNVPLSTSTSGSTVTNHGLNKAGGGTWIIAGNATYPGTTIINGGTLQIGSGGATGTLPAGDVTNNSNLVFNRDGSLNVAAKISGSGNLVKRGPGAVTLSAPILDYTGTTFIEDGSLIVNGDASAANGAVSLGDGTGGPQSAILGGTGVIGGAVTVASDGAIAPGNSTGELTVIGNVSGNGSLLVTIDAASSGSLIMLGGTIDISSLALNLSVPNAPTQTTYVIVNANSPITGAAFASVSGLPAGYSVVYNFNDGVDSNNIAIIGTPPSDPFDNWATTNGLSGGDAAPGADPDNDGLDNAIEFVIGGQPNPANPGAASNGLAPTIDASGSNLAFTFRRTDLALTQPGIAINVDYGSNLTGWTTVQDGVSGITVVPTNDFYGVGVDRVVVTIPKALAAGSSMFARLNVVIP